MIKNLIAVAMASILITQPPQNANDGTYYQDVEITESYEYETNEVNSVDDLVVGNIYELKLTNYTISDIWNLQYSKTYNKEFTSSGNLQYYNNNVLELFTYTNGRIYYTYDYIDNNYIGFMSSDYYPTINLDIYFVYSNISGSQYLINYISASDYLGEKTITVEPVETEGLYNLAYHFLYSRIYTNTELQGMETTLFGTTINMNMWLAHTTAIVIICLLLIVLIKFVIWLFKIVSGGMLWK